jgi:hypothetical protein
MPRPRTFFPAAAVLALAAGCAGTRPPARSPADCRSLRSARPHEEIRPAPDDVVDFHEVTFEVPGERAAFVEAFLREPLSTFIRGDGQQFPGVDHTEPLTEARFPAPGSVRLVCLADGNVADEEVLEQDERHLRYLVTNYSTPEAAPLRYGIGEFVFEPGEALGARPDAITRVRWRYTFHLRTDRFPGSLGGLGRWLFRRSFIEGDYARFMEVQVKDIRAFAERIALSGSQATPQASQGGTQGR